VHSTLSLDSHNLLSQLETTEGRGRLKILGYVYMQIDIKIGSGTPTAATCMPITSTTYVSLSHPRKLSLCPSLHPSLIRSRSLSPLSFSRPLSLHVYIYPQSIYTIF